MAGHPTRLLFMANEHARLGMAGEALKLCDMIEEKTTHMRKRDRDRWHAKADEVRARVTRTVKQ